MKRNIKNIPDMETIKRYWGSLEAYNKEQRDMALIDLENGTYQNNYTGPVLRWDFSSFKKGNQATEQKRARHSFHFFGR